MTGLLAQITAMRERSKQLALAAYSEFSSDNEITVRLTMIHDQFSAVEAMLRRDGAMLERGNKPALDLSIADIEHPAPAFASRQATTRNGNGSARLDSKTPS